MSVLIFRISYPVDFLFGLVVVSALLMGFVYLSSSPALTRNNTLASLEQFFRSAKEDRPIIVLVAILGVSYFILSMLGKLLIFLFGIVLPIQGLLFLPLKTLIIIFCFIWFSYYSSCVFSPTKFSK